MEALKYIVDFVKTCNLEMLYLICGNEVSLRHFNFLFSNALFTHFYDAIAFHSYEIYILMMLIEAPWFCIMIGGVLELFLCLNVKITTFELEKITFVVYLIVFLACMLNLWCTWVMLWKLPMEFRKVGWEITSSFGNLSSFNKDITQTLMH